MNEDDKLQYKFQAACDNLKKYEEFYFEAKRKIRDVYNQIPEESKIHGPAHRFMVQEKLL